MPDDTAARAQQEFEAVVGPGDHVFLTLGMTDVEAEDADLAVEIPVVPRVSHASGALQGGVTASLIDIVAARLATRGAEAGETPAMSDMVIHFLAPITGGPARAEGRVLRRGSRTVVVHVDVRDMATERLAAVSTVSFSLLAPLPDQ
ncbi:MAG TPA: PaaI family thioesterase [Acidimicrobiales bacterium]|nr:PaaI family thioesterase [Acidimicrobiales bacterium]